MDRNTITGFLLIALVVIGFGYFSRPSKEEIAQKRMQDSLALVNAKKEQQTAEKEKTKMAVTKADTVTAMQDTTTLFGNAKVGQGQKLVLQNKVVKLTINTHGGNITTAELKGYKNQDGKDVTLFTPQTASLDYILAMKEENLHTQDCFFNVSEQTDSTAVLTIQARDGSTFALKYKLLSNTYMVNMAIQAQGLDKYFVPGENMLTVDWQDSVKQQEKGYDFEGRYSTLTYKIKDEGTKYLSETKNEDKTPEETLDWVAFKNQFFSSVIISYQNFTKVKLTSEPLAKGSGFLKYYHANMETKFDPSGKMPTMMQFYLGPNQYQLLQKMNKYSIDGKKLKMERLVYLGWPLFRWINRYFTIYVFNWLSQMGLSMGVVLLLMTILLKVLVYPTTKKSYVSSAKMRVLKPKLDEIQKKYPNKEDSMKMQQEIMQTYSQYGVSPMGGCLPILLQTPIWIAMFNFVPNAIELRGQKFLWSNDLSTYDDVIHFSNNVPFIGDHISLFCVLFCVTNIVYSWLNMKLQKDSMASTQAGQQMKMMQWMMMLMPIFFFFMFNGYSAGLNYYYWISLLCSALIMWYLKWRTNDKKLLEKLEQNFEKKKNNPIKTKGLAARLEAMQKQQEGIKQHKRR